MTNSKSGVYHSRKFRDAPERRIPQVKVKNDGSYRAAVLNACYEAQIYTSHATPDETVAHLIEHHKTQALDPEVSRRAAALVARGSKVAYTKVAIVLTTISAIAAIILMDLGK